MWVGGWVGQAEGHPPPPRNGKPPCASERRRATVKHRLLIDEAVTISLCTGYGSPVPPAPPVPSRPGPSLTPSWCPAQSAVASGAAMSAGSVVAWP